MSYVPTQGDAPGMLLRVGFEERVSVPSLRGMSAAFFDFNLVYELGLILSNPAYSDYTFSPMRFWRRDGRPIREEHLARVVRLRRESPVDLLIAIPTAAAIGSGGLWAFWQMLERILDRPLNRAILESKVLQAEAETRKAVADASASEDLARLRRSQVAKEVGSYTGSDSPVEFERRLVNRVRSGELVPKEFELEGERLDG